MGVFSRHQTKEREQTDEPKVYVHIEEPKTENMIQCKFGHAIDGIVPTVDPDKFEVQHPELIGRHCDCQQLVYSEEACGCQHNQWGIKWGYVTFDYAAYEQSKNKQ